MNETGTPVAPAPSDALDNPEVREAIIRGVEMIRKLEEERREINAQIAAVRADWAARGLNRHATRAALAYHKLEEHHAVGYDTTTRIVRSALGVPVEPPAPASKPHAGEALDGEAYSEEYSENDSVVLFGRTFVTTGAAPDGEAPGEGAADGAGEAQSDKPRRRARRSRPASGE